MQLQERVSSSAELVPSRVLVVSDTCLYREGLARLLTHELAPAVIGTASSVAESRERLQRERADVVLVDLALPDALGAARLLAEDFPGVKLVGLGVQDDDPQIVACAEAGMTAFVHRAGSLADLVEAIRCAAAGELSCSKRIAGALVARVARLAGASRGSAEAAQLTQREIQVVRLVNEGLTNKEIASRLHISTATARNHVHNILDRLGVRTRARAAAVARRILSQV